MKSSFVQCRTRPTVLEVQDNYVLVQWPRKQAFRNDRQWNDAFTIDHSFSFDIPTVINGEGRIQPHINFLICSRAGNYI
jgi:hypothetical protein